MVYSWYIGWSEGSNMVPLTYLVPRAGITPRQELPTAVPTCGMWPLHVAWLPDSRATLKQSSFRAPSTSVPANENEATRILL